MKKESEMLDGITAVFMYATNVMRNFLYGILHQEN